jgi:hypothetical protein
LESAEEAAARLSCRKTGKYEAIMFAEAELNGDYADSATERMRVPFVELRPSRVLSMNDMLRRRFGDAVADAVLDEVAGDI